MYPGMRVSRQTCFLSLSYQKNMAQLHYHTRDARHTYHKHVGSKHYRHHPNWKLDYTYNALPTVMWTSHIRFKGQTNVQASTKYIRILRRLYKMGRASPVLRCLGEHKITLVLAEVHQVAWRSHTSWRASVHKLLREGYYKSSLMRDNMNFVI